MKAHAKKGSLIWVTGSLELEPYTKRDGISIDKRMKILLDNWGFVPVGRAGSSKQEPTPPEPKIPPKQEYDGIDGERDALPGGIVVFLGRKRSGSSFLFSERTTKKG